MKFINPIFKKAIFSGIAIILFSSLLAQTPKNAGDTVSITKGGVAVKAVKVRGTVNDDATGKPIAAVNIEIPGYSAALTDAKGGFTINAPNYDATLFVSAEGLQSREVALKGRKTVVVSMYEDGFVSLYDNAILPPWAKATKPNSVCSGFGKYGWSME